MTVDPQDQARILIEALPHMQQYDEEIVVVKYGGHAMGEEAAARSFARDIVLLEQTAINPVVVHGGGPQIGGMLKRLGIKSEFAGGLRVTDAETIEIVEMCWPAPSTSRLSASSTSPAARPSDCAARTATWCWPARSIAPWSTPARRSRRSSTSASSASPRRSIPPCSPKFSAAS